MTGCTKRGCNQREFMGTGRCFDHHQRMPGGVGMSTTAWFIVCALLGLALTGLGVWVVIELVQWVTSR